jgi:hypothetical protein
MNQSHKGLIQTITMYSFRVFVSTAVTPCKFLRVILHLSTVFLGTNFLRNCVFSDITKILTKESKIFCTLKLSSWLLTSKLKLRGWIVGSLCSLCDEVGIATIPCSAMSASAFECSSWLLTSCEKLCFRPSWTKSWSTLVVEARESDRGVTS